MVLKLDFRDDEIAQDMICLIMNDKNLQTPEKAVQSGGKREAQEPAHQRGLGLYCLLYMGT